MLECALSVRALQCVHFSCPGSGSTLSVGEADKGRLFFPLAFLAVCCSLF